LAILSYPCRLDCAFVGIPWCSSTTVDEILALVRVGKWAAYGQCSAGTVSEVPLGCSVEIASEAASTSQSMASTPQNRRKKKKGRWSLSTADWFVARTLFRVQILTQLSMENDSCKRKGKEDEKEKKERISPWCTNNGGAFLREIVGSE